MVLEKRSIISFYKLSIIDMSGNRSFVNIFIKAYRKELDLLGVMFIYYHIKVLQVDLPKGVLNI